MPYLHFRKNTFIYCTITYERNNFIICMMYFFTHSNTSCNRYISGWKSRSSVISDSVSAKYPGPAIPVCISSINSHYLSKHFFYVHFKTNRSSKVSMRSKNFIFTIYRSHCAGTDSFLTY